MSCLKTFACCKRLKTYACFNKTCFNKTYACFNVKFEGNELMNSFLIST